MKHTQKMHVKSVAACAIAACLIAASPSWGYDVDPVIELQQMQTELQRNSAECQNEILPILSGFDGEIAALKALASRLEDGGYGPVPAGGETVTIGDTTYRFGSLVQFEESLLLLFSLGGITLAKVDEIVADAKSNAESIAIDLRSRAKLMQRQKDRFGAYCRETETMLTAVTRALVELRAGGGDDPAQPPRPGRSAWILVNDASVTEKGLTCSVGETTASCVKITGADRCSYRAWWEFPSVADLKPGTTFELELKGAYACSYDAGPHPKRGPNWGTGVAYEYFKRGIEPGLMGISWSQPGKGGLPGWVGATGCAMYFGAHGSGSTPPQVSKTCTFWVPETFPNRRLHKAHPDHPDYQIRTGFSPVGWAAKWMIQ